MFFVAGGALFAGEGHHGINWKETSVPMLILACAPFTLLLLSIAFFPLVFEHWWHKNSNKAIISCVFGVPIAGLFLFTDAHTVLHTFIDYVAFLALLASLFIISGGIIIKGSYVGKPATCACIFLIGAVLANLVGTTGASMLLIRPLLRVVKPRTYKSHTIIFFIFVVSNCGGVLTPLGDPPLFLGFLKGVPFDWTLGLWKEWLVAVGAIVAVFFVFDSVLYGRESEEARRQMETPSSEGFGVQGAHNFVYLLMVIGVILFSGYFLDGWLRTNYGSEAAFIGSKLFQTVFMLLVAVIAYKTTAEANRIANEFTFYPIVEVAVLFAGIFAAMMAPLEILAARGGEFGVTKEWQFFWITGGLSSFLDNAPTYLTYTSLASGLMGTDKDNLIQLVDKAPGLLAAISCGAVFMGANTYIGNAPNFMVKSIAEAGGVKMPSFFGYMKWSIGILVPIFVLVTLIFFV